MEAPNVELQQVLDAAHQHAESLREPALLVSLRRDLEKLLSEWADDHGKKKSALRFWGVVQGP